ncbi:MAG: hypothetical protein AABZ30_08255 [Myxococcota bacterium]
MTRAPATLALLLACAAAPERSAGHVPSDGVRHPGRTTVLWLDDLTCPG